VRLQRQTVSALVILVVSDPTPTQPQTVWRMPEGDIELMPKKEIFDFKPALRLEQVGDKCAEQVEEYKHRDE
jgi:hypothetical protein